MAVTEPYILTLKLDQHTFETLNMLRQTHFPAARNVVPAHITLFHALPSLHEAQIRQDLAHLASTTSPLALTFPAVRLLGRGVAVALTSATLVQLRQQLASRWQPWLSAQDRQPYQPHVTIQNKVTPEAARRLFARLEQTWEPLHGIGEGLIVWQYVGGPWEYVAEYRFTHPDTTQS